jgi:hypothetical protein
MHKSPTTQRHPYLKMIQQTINVKNLKDITKHDEHKHIISVKDINKRKLHS